MIFEFVAFMYRTPTWMRAHNKTNGNCKQTMYANLLGPETA